jgi:hypothetical protein
MSCAEIQPLPQHQQKQTDPLQGVIVGQILLLGILRYVASDMLL